jgi:hypothetical protein
MILPRKCQLNKNINVNYLKGRTFGKMSGFDTETVRFRRSPAVVVLSREILNSVIILVVVQQKK